MLPIYIFIFILGLCIGSFLNVVIDRLSFDRSLNGRSKCDHCGKTLKAKNLFPVVSYLAQKGRSTCCNKKLSIYYPVVELITGTAFLAIIMLVFQQGFEHVQLMKVFGLLGIVSSLIVIFFADVKYHIIPDEATVAIVLFSFAHEFSEGILHHFVAGVIFFTAFYVLYFITKKKGIVFGDVKLAFAIGFLLGLKAGFIAIYLAFILGGIVSIFLLLTHKKKRRAMIAFVPFLVIGTVVMLFFSQQIIAVVHQLFGIL